MASNETTQVVNRFEGVTEYQNLTPAADLDQKTLNKMAWRSCFLQASFNYERMQAAGWLYSILPVSRRFTRITRKTSRSR